MKVDLRDLELLVAVADQGSITAGAGSVGLSLSAASSRITAMEATFDVRLLVRGRGGVVPTQAGGMVVERGRAMLAQADGVVEVLRNHREEQANHIRLASNTSAVDTLTEFLAFALSRFAGLRVELEEILSTEVARRVREGHADLGVVSVPPKDMHLTMHRLWADPLVIVRTPPPVGADARDDDDTPEVSFAEVMRGPMIGLTEGIPLQTIIDEHAQDLGVTPQYRVRLPTLSAVYAVASTGAGSAILPAGTVRRLGAPRKLVHRIAEPWAQREALLLTRAEKELSEMERSFVEAMLRFRLEETG